MKVELIALFVDKRLWYTQQTVDSLKTNVALLYVPLDLNGKYCRSAANDGNKYDFIIMDSEREEYKDGIDFLVNHSFRKLDFWGIVPSVLLRKCTTVFYSNNNCANI